MVADKIIISHFIVHWWFCFPRLASYVLRLTVFRKKAGWRSDSSRTKQFCGGMDKNKHDWTYLRTDCTVPSCTMQCIIRLNSETRQNKSLPAKFRITAQVTQLVLKEWNFTQSILHQKRELIYKRNHEVLLRKLPCGTFRLDGFGSARLPTSGSHRIHSNKNVGICKVILSKSRPAASDSRRTMWSKYEGWGERARFRRVGRRDGARRQGSGARRQESEYVDPSWR